MAGGLVREVEVVDLEMAEMKLRFCFRPNGQGGTSAGTEWSTLKGGGACLLISEGLSESAFSRQGYPCSQMHQQGFRNRTMQCGSEIGQPAKCGPLYRAAFDSDVVIYQPPYSVSRVKFPPSILFDNL
jgi:hypothetical protein